MKNEYEMIKEKILRFQNYGIEEREGCLLIGKPDYLPIYAWVNTIYSQLSEDEYKILEDKLPFGIPEMYKHFLLNFSNGLCLLEGNLNLYGYRKNYKRDISAILQPFDLDVPNKKERLRDSKKNYFFIGSYRYDGSKLYIDTETNHVHLCAKYNSTSLYEWSSLTEMLNSEIDRLYSLVNEDGSFIDVNKSTLPI